MPAGSVKFTDKLGSSKMGDGKMGGKMEGKMGSYKPAGESGVFNNQNSKTETTVGGSGKKGGY